MRVILGGLAITLAFICSFDPLWSSVTDDFESGGSMNGEKASMRTRSIVAHFMCVLDGDEVRNTNFPLYLRDVPNEDDIYELGASESVRALSCVLLESFSLDDSKKPIQYKLFLPRSMERNTIVLPCPFKGAKIHYALMRSKEFDEWMDFSVRIDGANGAIYRLESWLFPLEDMEDPDENVMQPEVFEKYFTGNAVLGVLDSKERLPIDHGSFMIKPKESLGVAAPYGLSFTVVPTKLRPYGRDPLRIDAEPLPFKMVEVGVYETDSLSHLAPYLDGIAFRVDIKKLSGEPYVFGHKQDNTYELINNEIRAYSSLCFILTHSASHFHLSARVQLSPIGGGGGGGQSGEDGSLEESHHRHIASFPILF